MAGKNDESYDNNGIKSMGTRNYYLFCISGRICSILFFLCTVIYLSGSFSVVLLSDAGRDALPDFR